MRLKDMQVLTFQVSRFSLSLSKYKCQTSRFEHFSIHNRSDSCSKYMFHMSEFSCDILAKTHSVKFDFIARNTKVKFDIARSRVTCCTSFYISKILINSAFLFT